MTVRLWVEVELTDDDLADDAAEKVFALLASDPADAVPEIDTVMDYGSEVVY